MSDGALRRGLVVLAVALSAAPALGAVAPFEIRPGPTAISAEEAALAGSAGEHAVYLLRESTRTDRTPTECVVEHHARIKVLTNEGRKLANLELPGVEGRTGLIDFWGRVLLPDGSVQELPAERLIKQSVVRSRTGGTVVLKGALPGVVPGAILDYGWKLRTVLSAYQRVDLQGRHRVLDYRLRWKSLGGTSRLRISRAEGRDIRTERDAEGIRVFARNLPAVIEEPFMPPLGEVRTAAHLYYVEGDDVREDYWGHVAQFSDISVRRFNRRGSLDGTIASLGLAPDDPLETRLRKAYAWVEANLRRTDLFSAEEHERSTPDDPEDEPNAAKILAAREGTAEDLANLFLGLARELGADARLIYVTDRTEQYFDAGLRTLDPFMGILVAVRDPDVAPDAWTIVDPGSGLSYAEVPWYFAGQAAPLLTGKKSAVVTVPASTALRNVTTTAATLRFAKGSTSVTASWSIAAKGQSGLDERRYLRGLSPAERPTRLAELCGKDAGWEVVSAGSPGLDAAVGSLELRCEVEDEGGPMAPDVSRYHVVPTGPWLSSAPDFSDASRVHPVVFPFPRSERVTIEVGSPAGFVPGEPPPAVTLSGRFGDYARVVTRTDRGFSVSRSLVLKSLVVPVADYAELREFLSRVHAAERTALTFEREDEMP